MRTTHLTDSRAAGIADAVWPPRARRRNKEAKTMTDNTQPEALIDLIDAYAETRHRYGGVYNAKTEAARKAVIEALSGVQALSAAPAGAAPKEPPVCPDCNGTGVDGDVGNDGRVVDCVCGGCAGSGKARFLGKCPDGVRCLHGCLVDEQCHLDRRAMLAASPTPPAEQQAVPKAAPGVGNGGFDHKTAADFLSGKTVSDEAVRKFVAASRWAHDERAALSATLLAMHGVLTSREAEIALLKKALLEAEAAHQPAPAPLSEMPYERRKAIQEGEQIGASDAWFKARHEMLDTLDRRNVFRAGFDRGWNAALAAQGGKA